MDPAKKLKLRVRVGSELARNERYASSRVEEELDAQNCSCGKAIQRRAHMVTGRELYREDRTVSEV